MPVRKRWKRGVLEPVDGFGTAFDNPDAGEFGMAPGQLIERMPELSLAEQQQLAGMEAFRQRFAARPRAPAGGFDQSSPSDMEFSVVAHPTVRASAGGMDFSASADIMDDPVVAEIRRRQTGPQVSARNSAGQPYFRSAKQPWAPGLSMHGGSPAVEPPSAAMGDAALSWDEAVMAMPSWGDNDSKWNEHGWNASVAEAGSAPAGFGGVPAYFGTGEGGGQLSQGAGFHGGQQSDVPMSDAEFAALPLGPARQAEAMRRAVDRKAARDIERPVKHQYINPTVSEEYAAQQADSKQRVRDRGLARGRQKEFERGYGPGIMDMRRERVFEGIMSEGDPEGGFSNAQLAAALASGDPTMAAVAGRIQAERERAKLAGSLADREREQQLADEQRRREWAMDDAIATRIGMLAKEFRDEGYSYDEALAMATEQAEGEFSRHGGGGLPAAPPTHDPGFPGDLPMDDAEAEVAAPPEAGRPAPTRKTVGSRDTNKALSDFYPIYVEDENDAFDQSWIPNYHGGEDAFAAAAVSSGVVTDPEQARQWYRQRFPNQKPAPTVPSGSLWDRITTPYDPIGFSFNNPGY